MSGGRSYIIVFDGEKDETGRVVSEKGLRLKLSRQFLLLEFGHLGDHLLVFILRNVQKVDVRNGLT
jgi:hypothetical protein